MSLRVLQGTELATSEAAPAGIPWTAFQSAVFEFAAFSPLFSVCLLLFFLTPGISLYADPYSRAISTKLSFKGKHCVHSLMMGV